LFRVEFNNLENICFFSQDFIACCDHSHLPDLRKLATNVLLQIVLELL
jgi:hypothetical protein